MPVVVDLRDVFILFFINLCLMRAGIILLLLLLLLMRISCTASCLTIQPLV